MTEGNSLALTIADYNLLIPPLARKTMTAEEFEKKPIGTGPYRAIEFARDKPVRLEAWDGYRLGKPTPERLTIRHVPDPSTRVAELLAGRAQIAQHMPIDALPSLAADPKLEVVSLKGAAAHWYPINVFKTTPPLRDKRIRQAMNYAIDREGIAKAILRGYGFAMPGPFWAGWMGHTDDIKPFPYDPERAKALLREAGHPNGFAFEWLITRGVFQKDFEIGEAMANQLAKVGIKANLVPVERARMLAQRSTGNYDVWMTGAWPMSWEPSQVWTFLLGPTSLPDDKLTQWGPAPPELVEARRLAREAAGTRDLQERAQRQAQLVRLMHDEAFWIYVTVIDDIWGIQKSTRWRPYPSALSGHNFWYDYWAMIGKQAPPTTTYDMLLR
jgi:peptide/nickel transport system substrate-binding protein